MGSFKDYDRMPFPQSTGILSAFFILGLGVVLLTMFSSSVDAGSVPHAPISITGDSEFTSSNGVVSGSGKPSDPYFIQNWRIDASSDIGIQIYSTDRYYIIRNITLSGESSTPGYTIYTEYSNNGTFEDIYDDRNLSRLWIKDAKNLVMHNYTQSRPDDPLERGPFALLGCRSARVSNLSLSGRLYFTVMDDAVLTRSTARDYYLRSTKRLTVLDCTNRGDDEHDGIFLFYMEDSLIKNCTINNTRSADIRIEKSSNITVSKCTMDSWGLVVSLDGYHHLDDSNKVNGSLVHSFINRSDFTHQSSSSQMFFFGCSDFTVANVTIWDTASPIHLYECRNVLIDNVTISGRFSYMYMARCDDVTLSNITTHSYRGSGRSPVLYIYDSPNVLVRDSLLSYCQLRFYIDRLKDVPSGALTVLNTTFAHSSSGGIRFDGPGFHDLFVDGCTFNDCRHDGILTIRHRDVRVTNTKFVTMYGDAIELSQYEETWDERVRISNCTFDTLSGAGMAIFYRFAEDLVIENNQIVNAEWTAITLPSANGVKISNNTISNVHRDTYPHGVSGVYLNGDNFVMSNNRILNCDFGITLDNVRDSYIWNTEIEGCDMALKVLGNCSGSFFYHNVLVKNNYNSDSNDYEGRQAYSLTAEVNLSLTMEGNYWADYSTWYPDAKPLGDKLWDTPYTLELGRVSDPYPLRIKPDWRSPVAKAGDDMSIPEGTTVMFDASGSTDDRGIVTYRWIIDHPDGQNISLERVHNFTFNTPGIAKVVLEVWDLWGIKATDSIKVTVLDITPPRVDAGANISIGVGQEFTLNVGGSSDNVGIVAYSWTIDPEGINLTYNGSMVKTSISTVGIYIVRLRVVDAAGNWAEDELVLNVVDSISPVAVARDDQTVDQWDEVVLDGRDSYDNIAIQTWSWTFEYNGEQVNLSGPSVTFTFSHAGTYVVKLTVTDAAGLIDSDDLVVVVRDVESPVADAGLDLEVDPGEEFVLDASGSTDNVGITSYLWTFDIPGGMKDLTGKKPTLTIDDSGTYIVTLETTDADGNLATDNVTIVVLDTEPPIADAGMDVTIDQETTFTLHGEGSTDNIGVTKWIWTFDHGGENVTLEGEAPPFTFDIPGIYDIHLTVEDEAGNEANTSVEVIVSDTESPVAITTGDTTIQEGTELILDASASTDNVRISLYKWTIDDPGGPVERSGMNITYLFEMPGNYTVTLIVTDGWSNSDEVSFTVVVTPIHDPNGNGGNGGGGDDESYLLYVIIALVIIIVAVVLIIYLKKVR